MPDAVQRAAGARTCLQCPYCHAYEVADRQYAFLATKPADLDHALLLRGWSRDVIAVRERFRSKASIATSSTGEAAASKRGRSAQSRARMAMACGCVLEGGERVVRPGCSRTHRSARPRWSRASSSPSTTHGTVAVDKHYETSVPGVHAAGDLMTRVHSAQVAAGQRRGRRLCRELRGDAGARRRGLALRVCSLARAHLRLRHLQDRHRSVELAHGRADARGAPVRRAARERRPARADRPA